MCKLRRVLTVDSPADLQVLSISEKKQDIDSIAYEDLNLGGYRPHAKIAMQMAV